EKCLAWKSEDDDHDTYAWTPVLCEEKLDIWCQDDGYRSLPEIPSGTEWVSFPENGKLNYYTKSSDIDTKTILEREEYCEVDHGARTLSFDTVEALEAFQQIIKTPLILGIFLRDDGKII
ncbi:unnamed protein product, partial [Meganyctiphanes norvegica]